MKKAFFILALGTLSLASCKKDYSCECVTNSPNGSSSETNNTGKMKLEDARTKCNEGDQTREVLGQTYTTDCSIK